MNWLLVRPLRLEVLVAVPRNTAPGTPVLSWMPGPIVENPEIALAGVNVGELLTVATKTLAE
jgi:hypothetical protein